MELKLIQKLKYYNPWWRGEKIESGVKRKEYLDQIKPFLKSEEILALIGVRRAGKTFLIYQLINQLLKANPKNKDKIIFLEADDEIIAGYLKNQGLLYIIQEYLNYQKKDFSQPLFVFIDEIQDINQWEIQLKNIFDLKKNIKIVISGSSAARMKKDSLKKLVGRIIFFEIHPLSFSEFVLFKEKINIEDKLDFSKIKEFVGNKIDHQNILKRNFNEYLEFGGYPRIVLEESVLNKEKILRDYLDLILKRDISSVFCIEHMADFEGMLKFLAQNISGRISFFRISKETGLKIETVKKYYFYLQQSFLAFHAEYYKTTLKKTRHPYKFYFSDSGIRNFLIGEFGLEPSKTKLGFLAENFIAQRFQKAGTLFYSEDKNKNEIDFIVQEKNKLIPVEVKFKNEIKESDLSGLASFISAANTKNKIKQAIVVTKDLYQEKTINKKEVLFIPAYFF